MSKPAEIGVVGGGASAVCLLDALARAESVPGSITVFESSLHLWRGRAYLPDSSCVRVNAPPDDMSVRYGDSNHFEQWLAARDLIIGPSTNHVDEWSGTRYVPRAIFGDYLEQSARSALLVLLRRGCQVELLREGVETAERTDDAVVLRTPKGTRRRVDYAVLCVGGGPPADVYGLADSPNFVMEPYPVGRTIAGINPDQDIAVVGSGLTAVDVVLALAYRGHRGRISMLSRTGMLPSVRQRQIHYQLRHFTPDRFQALAARHEGVTLDQLIGIMTVEMAAAGQHMLTVTDEIATLRSDHPVTWLRRQLATVNAPELGLRILQRAVPETGPDVWPLLSQEDKSALLRDHYRTIMSLCCPMPPASAAKLLDLVESGQLEIMAGVHGIEALSDKGFRVTKADGDWHADIAINAVNAPRHRIPPSAGPLVNSLVERGKAVPHFHGGLHVERATSRLTVQGRADPRLYALGDLAAGTLFFTFGVPSLVDRAHDIAMAIMDHVRVSGVQPITHVLQTS
jgi:uncharacterized NAD(P)/FAD-binding protein YdhS